MNGTVELMFTATKKRPALLSDLTGLAKKLASKMSGKWQRSEEGGTRGGKKKAKRTSGEPDESLERGKRKQIF